MRIGIVWPLDVPLAVTTVRFERYLRGFKELGHESVIVSTAAAAVGFPWAGITVPTRSTLQDSVLWADLGLDAVLVVNWLGMPELLSAIRPHVRTLWALADSDGCIGVRVFPLRLLSRMWLVQPTFAQRLRTAGWWARQLLLPFAAARVAAPIIASCRMANQTIVFSPGAKENLAAFFDSRGVAELVDRIRIAPYPIDESFTTGSVPAASARSNRVVAIGRWADPQKGAKLLASAIRQYLLRKGGHTKFTLLGADADSVFTSLRTSFPGQVDCPGPVPQEKVAELLRESRVLLSTSHWESGPIVAAEALSVGCSLVGPASIPSFRQFCSTPGCGTTFSWRTGRAVVTALVNELTAWDAGLRTPAVIADTWRSRFTPKSVCEQILAGLDKPKHSAQATGVT